MAASGGSDFSSDVVCPVCLDTYRNPKILTCGHTLCQDCVDRLRADQAEVVALDHELMRERWMLQLHGNGAPRLPPPSTNRLKCPTCRTFTNVPRTGLPTNYQLAELLSRITISENKKAKRTKCDVCEGRFDDQQCWHCVTCSETSPQNRCCSKCCVKSHNGHQLLELCELQRQKEEAAKNVDMIYEQTEKCIDEITENDRAVAVMSKDIAQTLKTESEKLFGELVSSLESKDICSTAQLSQSQEDAAKLKERISELCNNIKATQQTALTELTTCRDQLKASFKNETDTEATAQSPYALGEPGRDGLTYHSIFGTVQCDSEEDLELMRAIEGLDMWEMEGRCTSDFRPSSPTDSLVVFHNGQSYPQPVEPPTAALSDTASDHELPTTSSGLGGVGRGRLTNYTAPAPGTTGRGHRPLRGHYNRIVGRGRPAE